MRRDVQATTDGMSVSAWSRDSSPRRRRMTDDYVDYAARMDARAARIDAMLRVCEAAVAEAAKGVQRES